MKPGRGKRRSLNRNRPKRRPPLAGRPLSASDVDAVKSLAAQTVHGEVAAPLIKKLSHYKIRALVLSVLWLALFVVGLTGLDSLRQDSLKVTRTGVQVEGTVLEIEGSTKPNRVHLTLTYPAGAKSHTISVPASTSDRYQVGDKVSLTYAAGDPQRVLTVRGSLQGDSSGNLRTLLTFAALLGFPVCLYAAWLWRQRYRSASKTGLREATATVRPSRLFPRIDVFFENEYKFLATRRSLRIAPRVRKVPVFVGGEGTDMIVIFPRGRFRKDTLYAVPVKEIEPDTD